MGRSLIEIAQQLKDSDKKVQLIYAFNGIGKTRLSLKFIQLIADSNANKEGGSEPELVREKILYYNAFTEDLFFWDNDLISHAEPKMIIQPNKFTDWILKNQGQDRNIIANFQRYANQKLTPHFSENFTEVTFSLERGNDDHLRNLKISKSEERTFIWSFFYTLLDQVISILDVTEPTDRETDQFDQLKYVFIDDPVSSLDENHLIELAVNLGDLIKSKISDLRFIITTHNPVFYNVLFSELNNKTGYLLERFEDGTFELQEKGGQSNKSFSYHLHLIQTIDQAVAENQIQKYHFTLLRNLYEKTASFLGYRNWQELLPDDKQTYFNRIIQFTSHSQLSGEIVAALTPQEKKIIELLLNHLLKNYGFWQQDKQVN
ncbi:MAG: anticodon nuclease [Bacteroidetes bacterium]|nr:anticodon nuclease [Bacteroidota bacterium]